MQTLCTTGKRKPDNSTFCKIDFRMKDENKYYVLIYLTKIYNIYRDVIKINKILVITTTF